jgi:hypothetical protein
MDNVSRPLIGVLIAAVAALALGYVMLSPSSSSKTGQPRGLGQYQSAINKAHQAATTANAASAAEGGTVATTSTTSATSRSVTAPRSATKRVAQHVQVDANTPQGIAHALQKRKVVALLFYNPAATDDKAVKQELASVSTHSGKVVKLAVPIGQLARYSLVTNQVPIQVSPTLVLIDRSRDATTIVGFSDRFEIAQRVDDALS